MQNLSKYSKDKKIDSIINELLEHILLNRPNNVPLEIIKYLTKKYPYETRGVIVSNSILTLEPTPMKPITESDSKSKL